MNQAMWQCPKCSEELEDTFDTCWNCGTSTAGVEDPSFQKVDGIEVGPDFDEVDLARPLPETDPFDIPPHQQGKPKHCRDCGVALSFLGQIAFTRRSDSLLLSLLAAFSEHDDNLESFPIDVFRCPDCGKLELYDLDHSLPVAED